MNRCGTPALNTTSQARVICRGACEGAGEEPARAPDAQATSKRLPHRTAQAVTPAVAGSVQRANSGRAFTTITVERLSITDGSPGPPPASRCWSGEDDKLSVDGQW